MGRDMSRVIMQSLKPSPSFQRRLATGTRTSSNTTCAVSEVRMPSLFSFLPMLTPRRVAVHHERHDALVLELLVRRGEDRVVVGHAAVGDELLRAVEDVGVAVQLRRHGEARRVGAGAGFDEQNAPRPPLFRTSKKRFFWSLLPPITTGSAPSIASTVVPTPASPRASSSQTTAWPTKSIPGPPNSSGTPAVRSPTSCSFFHDVPEVPN